MTKLSPVSALLKSFEDFMHHNSWNRDPKNLYEPVEYILTIGGKRLRPVSLIYLAGMLNGNQEAAMNAAYGLELFHNFSLVHDDIMDQSELRRSLPTVHKKFGLNQAILSGDVLMIESIRYLKKAEQLAGIQELTDEFTKTAIEVCEGQAMDLDFETRQDIGFGEYLEMIRLKTAVLLAFSFKAAAMLSARPDLSQAFYECGIQTGIAFQLEDDWLDFYTGSLSLGKTRGGDFLQAKKSALVLELMEQFNSDQKTRFISWYHDVQTQDLKIKVMSDYLEEYGIREKLLSRIQNHRNKAKQIINNLALEENLKQGILNFLESHLERSIV